MPKKVMDVLLKKGVREVDLLLELSFREREPIDSTVIDVLKQSVAYWRSVVSS